MIDPEKIDAELILVDDGSQGRLVEGDRALVTKDARGGLNVRGQLRRDGRHRTRALRAARGQVRDDDGRRPAE